MPKKKIVLHPSGCSGNTTIWWFSGSPQLVSGLVHPRTRLSTLPCFWCVAVLLFCIVVSCCVRHCGVEVCSDHLSVELQQGMIRRAMRGLYAPCMAKGLQHLIASNPKKNFLLFVPSESRKSASLFQDPIAERPVW